MNGYVDRDEVLRGTCADVEEKPYIYKVSKEGGLFETEKDLIYDHGADTVAELTQRLPTGGGGGRIVLTLCVD